MKINLPRKMKAVRQIGPLPENSISDPKEILKVLELTELDLPKPGPGQVLIKVNRGSMNPNDLYHIKGVYSSTLNYPYPRGVGFEGAGTVVANGGGIVGRMRLGKRVAFYTKNGLFAEYVLADALKLIVLPNDVEFQEAASSVANPITGIGMARWAKVSGSKYFFITAAAGAVARMTMRAASKYGLKSIAIVHREEQKEICKEEGASYVLNQSDPDFEKQLTELCKEVNCRYGFDCIGGDMPLTLIRSMPQGSTLCMYGYFNTGPMLFQPQKLFNGWKIQFFETEYYINSLSLPSRFLLSREVIRNVNGIFRPKIQRQFPMDQIQDAYAYYSQNMTDGKIQILCESTMRQG
ncbi:oxidoreductase [Leptospira selangorensis]|uniref:Oxidoreductase n=1 Tax=Leptospira selangorensis TaxID=2484982 RepID=A0A5F2C262_9LEPT|nr:zinc-binding dehydrogenase [Leptospira selangorensis]TGM12999.1 oxidoreductase [Leptospira selangorensis]TGM21249.1 oxidoreductase [Leptospira selangorensis]